MSAVPVDSDTQPDSADANRFLTALDPNATRWTFQTFDDSAEKRPELAGVLHGSLAGKWDALCARSRRGAGVFVTINATDFAGRKESNITRVRALFADFDQAGRDPRGELNELPFPPSMLICSSPGKWHAYWMVDGIEVGEFTAFQAAVIARLGSDSKIKDLSRVLRLPGFDHAKGDRHRVVIEELAGHRYTRDDMLAQFPTVHVEAARRDAPAVKPPSAARMSQYAAGILAGVHADVAGAVQGTRNDTLYTKARKLFSLAATGQISDALATSTLQDAAHACGMSDGEASAAIESARRATIEKPDDLTPPNRVRQPREHENPETGEISRVAANDKPVVVKAQPQALNDAAQAVADLNESHALTMMGDKVVVLRETVSERHGKELLYLSTTAFRTWYMNRLVPVEVSDKEGKPATKHLPVADLWLKSRERRQYEGVTFAPGNNAPDCYYNLWAGFAVEPMRGSLFDAAMKCRRLLSHVKYNLCSGNRGHFRYLLAWAADMVQDPDRKKGVALVLRGLKGTGKSTFGDALSALLGRHSMKVAHMRHLTGNFNRHLADKLLIVAEESFWAGDKADEGPLKDMITSERMTIEAKGVDAVEMPSLCRVMMITNSDWAVPASTDERRYFVLDVGDRRRQDFDYFARIEHQMSDGGLQALLAVLQQFPVRSVNLRKVPETSGIRGQRALSLEPHDQFVFDALCDSALLGQEWDGPVTLDKEALYAAYIDASRMRGKSHLKTRAHFAARFIACTGATPARPREGLNRLQVFRVPAWNEAAANFAKCCGVDVARLVEVPDEPF